MTYADDEDEEQDDDETDRIMKNDWQRLVVQECDRAQHDKIPNIQEDDPLILAREEIQASRHNNY
ncbi:hypothetical protein AMTR_s00101p00129880 [Amborella trichopoda]|uniref:Uncharacterized protein n=1 Tax=Amborella trichopoda TaxID=13333 RepID=W1NQB3_AMBTC|nr:hypothetical protein AMTR_s00101p00129880 [Amborella trichopoda]